MGSRRWSALIGLVAVIGLGSCQDAAPPIQPAWAQPAQAPAIPAQATGPIGGGAVPDAVQPHFADYPNVGQGVSAAALPSFDDGGHLAAAAARPPHLAVEPPSMRPHFGTSGSGISCIVPAAGACQMSTPSPLGSLCTCYNGSQPLGGTTAP